MEQIELQAKFPLSREKTILFFWNIIKWHQAYGYIHQVKIDFDNGRCQEFSMQLEWQNKLSQISIVRLKNILGDIDFFCPIPPENMVYHQGQWIFLENDSHSCTIFAKRQYKLKENRNETFSGYKLRSKIFREEFSERIHHLLSSLQNHLSQQSCSQ